MSINIVHQYQCPNFFEFLTFKEAMLLHSGVITKHTNLIPLFKHALENIAVAQIKSENVSNAFLFALEKDKDNGLINKIKTIHLAFHSLAIELYLEIIPEYCQTLSFIEIDYQPTGNKDTGVIALANNCPKLQYAKLGNCDCVTSKSIILLAERCAMLQVFELYNGYQVEDDAISALAKCQSLQRVVLNHCIRITDFAVKLLASSCKDLQELNLYECSKITDESIEEVALQCSNLRMLDLSLCSGITDIGAKAIASGCKNLEFISFYGCHDVTIIGIRALVEGCLNLRKCYTAGCDVSIADYLEIMLTSAEHISFS